MNCTQAEIAMMEHMEKSIHPATAHSLAKHVLTCELCREYYLAMDMAMDVLNDAELSVPPETFTQDIMTKIQRLPAYAAEEKEPRVSPVLRILWGLSAIALGIGLMFFFNPTWLASLAEAYPTISSILYALDTAWLFVTGLMERVTAAYQSASLNVSLLNFAIMFAFAMGVVLAVLQRSEKRTNK